MISTGLSLNGKTEMAVSPGSVLNILYFNVIAQDNVPSLDKGCVFWGYFLHLSQRKPTLEISISGI